MARGSETLSASPMPRSLVTFLAGQESNITAPSSKAMYDFAQNQGNIFVVNADFLWVTSVNVDGTGKKHYTTIARKRFHFAET